MAVAASAEARENWHRVSALQAGGKSGSCSSSKLPLLNSWSKLGQHQRRQPSFDQEFNLRLVFHHLLINQGVFPANSLVFLLIVRVYHLPRCTLFPVAMEFRDVFRRISAYPGYIFTSGRVNITPLALDGEVNILSVSIIRWNGRTNKDL